MLPLKKATYPMAASCFSLTKTLFPLKGFEISKFSVKVSKAFTRKKMMRQPANARLLLTRTKFPLNFVKHFE